MKAFIESARSQLEKSASCLLPMCFHRRCFSSSLLLLYISEVFLLFRLFPPINVMPLCLSLTSFLSLSLQVQENVFVEFNHQQLLDLYNKVCFIMFRVRVRATFMPHHLRVFVPSIHVAFCTPSYFDLFKYLFQTSSSSLCHSFVHTFAPKTHHFPSFFQLEIVQGQLDSLTWCLLDFVQPHTHRHTQAHELYVNGVFADSHAAVRGLAIKFCALIYLRNMSSLKKWVPFWTPFCTHYSEPGFYSGKLPQIHQYELYLNKFV